MLPSTGYFKAISCPFYESGTCDRPYCHFKHSKREDVGVSAEATETVESDTAGQVQEAKTSMIVSSGSDVLQKLVTEAVKQVLANQDATNTDQFSCQNVVSQVVEGLTPTLTSGPSGTLDTIATNTAEKRVDASTSVSKTVPCVYNPTPIAELKKRHIPIVSYMPTRESRVAAKRKCSSDGMKPWLATACVPAESAEVSELKYKPTMIINNPEIRDVTQSYIPTYKLDSASAYFYKDENSSDYLFKLREPYYPKCKKRREEYVPKMVKTPLKTAEGSNESALEQLDRDFGMIDETTLVRPKSTSPIRSNESFADSRFDLEAKFSDDDDDDGGDDDDDDDDEEAEEEEEDEDESTDQNVNKIDSENTDCTPVEENELYRNVRRFDLGGLNRRRGHDVVAEERSKINVENDRGGDERNFNGTVLRNSNVLKQVKLSSEENAKTLLQEEKKRSATDTGKSGKVNAEEGKSRDKNKSKGKHQKNRDKSHKRYKDSKHDSNETSRSASHNKSKSKINSEREKGKESKNGKSDKQSDRSRHKDHKKRRSKERERVREKEKEKEKERERETGGSKHKTSRKDKRKDYEGSEKRKERGSKNCSDSSLKRQEYIEKRNDESKRPKSDEKLKDKTSGKVHRHAKYRDERSSTDRSASSSLESTGWIPTDDDDDEENYDYHDNNTINMEVDVTFSTSDSDHDVQEECLKIFQEYQVPERAKSMDSSKESRLHGKEENEEIGRKRVAHPSAAVCVTRQTGVHQQAKKTINPQQKMYERWRLMRDTVVEKARCMVNAGGGGGDKSDGDVGGCGSNGSNIIKDVRRNCVEAATITCNTEVKLNGGNGRVRIAHVPYAKSLAIEKKKVREKTASTTSVTSASSKWTEMKAAESLKTAAQTAKSGVRIAHIPQVVPQLIRPEPLQVATQKFPLNVRQYYVNMMHDVCVLIYTNAEDAAQRAVKEEHACHERCKALAVYKNSCMLAAHRLRKEVDQNQSAESNAATTSSGNSLVSHEAVLAGKAKGSWSVLKTKKSVTEFRGAALYGMLKKWIMSEQQLRDNGFPRPHPDGQKGRAKVYVINSRNQSVLSKVPNERVCCRCGQTYMIDKQGFALQPQNCIYHWGRKFTIKGEGKYSCCQQYGSATGCCDAKTHVWDYTDYENLRGYVKTLPKDDTTTIEEQGVYALDCEMCYTTQGLELTRITIIDEDCNVVYETLVKPQNPIIDYNTRFSGITEESMKDVTTTLLDVQATILTMFSKKTILVGHSLESDFKALRLLHDTVVDTSVMFPHKNGYPQKRALKNLCSEYLRKLIQNDVGGHDSKEDAMACMELILWKAKEEAKLQ